MANTNLNLVGLDFQDIKDNLKSYLKRTSSPFKDIDYEGSNINSLLDVLSYNTFLNSFYLNMVASEMFLDSAVLRDSVISHAKELNYVPRSFRSAEAKISFTVTPSASLDALLIPKGTTFTTRVRANNYTFSTNTNIVLVANSSGIFNANNISIFEGVYVTDSFVYTGEDENQRFVLSNPTIDTSSMSVFVTENNGSNTYSYQRAESFLGQTANSLIYFLQPAENSQYEIVFGDNNVGRTPQSGAVITVEYRVSNGEQPNGASTFVIDGPIQGQANISAIITEQVSRSGSVSETLESIKFNATKHYQNQGRAVTPSDYENLLLANFSEITAVAAYGGEDATPPQYGRVYLSVDVAGSQGASNLNKTTYANFIKSRSTLGLQPVFFDPEFLNVEVKVIARYDVNTSTLPPAGIESLIRNVISDYNEEFLDKFKVTLRRSKLVERVNNAHPSILGIDLNIYPYFSINPINNTFFNKTLDYGFPFARELSLATESERYIKNSVKAVYSSNFTFNSRTCTIQDNRDGTIGIYSINNGVDVLLENIGTIDYERGTINITNLKVESYTGEGIHLHVLNRENDISAVRNNIITIKDSDVTVTAVASQPWKL